MHPGLANPLAGDREDGVVTRRCPRAGTLAPVVRDTDAPPVLAVVVRDRRPRRRALLQSLAGVPDP